ncbi:MAG: SIMPL domain-containing protein [Acidimicrobiaceae bacterium]
MTSFKKAIGFIGACSLMASCGFSLGEENIWDVTQPIETGVTVEATGSVKVVPDAVQFNFSVFAIDMTSSSALERATGLASQAREALEKAKIDKDDIATQSVSIYPEFSYSQDGKQNLIGFRATQSFAVTLRDTASAGEVVDAVVASVGTDLSIDTLSPILIDSKDASEQARESAIKLAKKKAEDYADLLGVDLGNVISLREFATSGATSQPWLRADLAVSESSKTVVDLGTQEVSVTVEARWAFASDN